MTGKLLAVVILVTALVAGAAIYYFQVYYYYEEIPATGPGDVQLTAKGAAEPEPLAHDNFRAIDAMSSPIRYRACFETRVDPATIAATYQPYPRAVPLQAPGWFSCFDADAIGAALRDGTARAYLGEAHIRYGIDRVVAITDAGKGHVWHQINRCGKVVFDGRPAPEGCPEPKEGD